MCQYGPHQRTRKRFSVTTITRKVSFIIPARSAKHVNIFESFFYLPTTVGYKSMNTARGTCFPAPVSLKNVLKESSPPPIVLSLGIWPLGWIPCSKQYNSQQAFPIWTLAWPTWTETHSRYETRGKSLGYCAIRRLQLTAQLLYRHFVFGWSWRILNSKPAWKFIKYNSMLTISRKVWICLETTKNNCVIVETSPFERQRLSI